jgi:hypothetical protein
MTINLHKNGGKTAERNIKAAPHFAIKNCAIKIIQVTAATEAAPNDDDDASLWTRSLVCVCYCRLKWGKKAHTEQRSFHRALATVDVETAAANPLLHTHLQCAHPQRLGEITSLWFAECVSQLLLRSSHRMDGYVRRQTAAQLFALFATRGARCTVQRSLCGASISVCVCASEAEAYGLLALSRKPPERFCALICFERCHKLFEALPSSDYRTRFLRRGLCRAF